MLIWVVVQDNKVSRIGTKLGVSLNEASIRNVVMNDIKPAIRSLGVQIDAYNWESVVSEVNAACERFGITYHIEQQFITV